MLNIFRQRQTLVKAVFGVILFLVVVSMAITLIPGIGGDSGAAGGNPVVAEVAGERITEFDVQQNVQQVSQRNRIPAEMMPFYTNQILNDMILEKVSLREAGRLGLRVDESELAAQLRQDPSLFPSGNFVGQAQYEEVIYQRFGMSVPQFEQRYRQALLLEKLRQLVTDSIAVTPAEIHEAFVKENEKITVDYVALLPVDFKKSVTTTDSALEEYYKTSKDRYQIPEKRSAKIVLIEKEKARQALSVSDEEIKKYYQDHMDTYRVQERVSARHILLKADPKNTAEMDSAKKKAEDLLKKVKAGGDFAALAKQSSDDKPSAEKGGDLGWIVRKQTVPEFEKAAFSLAPGTVSDPVQTVYGIHIIKVTAHEQAHLQPLDEVKSTIQSTLLEDKVTQAVTDEANQAAFALADPKADMAAVAAKYHGQVLTPAPFAQGESLPHIGASDAFMRLVFGLTKGQPGSPVPVAEGYAIPFLADIFPPHQGEFAEVKERVTTDYIDEQSRSKAAAKAQELAKALEQQKDKKDLKAAAKGLGLTVKTSAPVTREAPIPGLGSATDLGPKAFEMPVGGTAGPVTSAGVQVVYQIQSHEAPKEEELASKKTEIQERLLNQKRQGVFEVFQDSLKAKLVASGELKLHQDVLARLTSATPRP